MSENRSSMNACIFDGTLRRTTLPIPSRSHDEVLVKITRAGICNTDHEIIRGYVPDFNGIPGHEFIGTIDSADEITIIGSRCGRFSAAVDFLLKNDIPLENLISKEFKLEDVVEAFEYSSRADTMKVLLKM